MDPEKEYKEITKGVEKTNAMFAEWRLKDKQEREESVVRAIEQIREGLQMDPKTYVEDIKAGIRGMDMDEVVKKASLRALDVWEDRQYGTPNLDQEKEDAENTKRNRQVEAARMAYLRGMSDRLDAGAPVCEWPEELGKVQMGMPPPPPADYEFAHGRPSWSKKGGSPVKVKKPVMGAFVALMVGSVAILGVRMILWILGNALDLGWGYADRVPAAVLIVAGVTTVFMGLGQIDTEKSLFMTVAGFVMVAAAVVVLV